MNGELTDDERDETAEERASGVALPGGGRGRVTGMPALGFGRKELSDDELSTPAMLLPSLLRPPPKRTAAGGGSRAGGGGEGEDGGDGEAEEVKKGERVPAPDGTALRC